MRVYGGFQQSITQAFEVTVEAVTAALGRNGRGKAPPGSLVIETELLETVHQVIQPLPLLVDDFPVVG